MKIAHHDTNNRAFIIAEIGNNHEGDFNIAVQLITEAAKTGVDAVKFQTFIPELFVNPSQIERFERIKKFQLSFKQFEQLAYQARDLGLLFLSTPLDLESADFLIPIVDALKIGSGENTFYPLLSKAAQSMRPLIISTGLLSLAEVCDIKTFVEKERTNNNNETPFALLHCVSAYPAPYHQAHLGAITALQRQFPELTIGYSDHTLGIQATLTAIALGAKIIEKHFTLDKQFSSFRDHALSADTSEMTNLVNSVRLVESMIGTPTKAVGIDEALNTQLMRRSIVAKHNLSPDRPIEWSDLAWTRPALGLSPGEEHRLLGHRPKETVLAGVPLSEEMLKEI